MTFILFNQDFSNTASVGVTHNLDRLYLGVRVIINSENRTDLINQIITDSNDPRNVIHIYLSGTYSGTVQILEADVIPSLDFIQVNSGTCTGDFEVNTISANSVFLSGPNTADHVVANSGTIAAGLTAGSFQGNNGLFLTSLTVSGIPVRIDSAGIGSGITAVVQDPAPVLGGNLNANSNNISGVNSLTGNTANFAVSTTTDLLIANSGTLSGKITVGTFQGNTGAFSTSLTISGSAVMTNGVSAVTISGGAQKTGVLNFTGSRAGNVSVVGNNITFDAVPGLTSLVQDTSPTLGGDLNGNSKNISALNSITANTGSFPISLSAGTISNNSTSTALTTTTDHLVANSGTFTAKVIAGAIQAGTGTFSSSLTISGISVPTLASQRTYYFISGAATASTNATANPQFYNNTAGFAQRVDFTNCREVRFEGTQVAVGSSASCRISCDGRVGSYSITRTDYTTIATAGVNGNLSLDSSTANAYKDTGWLPLLPSFQTECFLAVVISGGNGSADPSFSQLKVSAR